MKKFNKKNLKLLGKTLPKSKNYIYSLKLIWNFNQNTSLSFDKSFIEECFSNNLSKSLGIIGSAGINPQIKSIFENDHSCTILIKPNEMIGFRTAMTLACNAEGYDQKKDFKIIFSDIEIIESDEYEI